MSTHSPVTTHPTVRNCGHLLALVDYHGVNSIGWHLCAGHLFITHPLDDDGDDANESNAMSLLYSGQNDKEMDETPPARRRSRRLRDQKRSSQDQQDQMDVDDPSTSLTETAKTAQATKRQRETPEDPEEAEEEEQKKRQRKRARQGTRQVSPGLGGTGVSDLVDRLPLSVLSTLVVAQGPSSQVGLAARNHMKEILRADRRLDIPGLQKRYPPGLTAWLLGRSSQDVDLALLLSYLGQLDAKRSEHYNISDLNAKYRRTQQQAVAWDAVRVGAKNGNVDQVRLGLQTSGLPNTLAAQNEALGHAAVGSSRILEILLAHGKQLSRPYDWDRKVARYGPQDAVNGLSKYAINITRSGLGSFLLLCTVVGRNWKALDVLLDWSLEVAGTAVHLDALSNVTPDAISAASQLTGAVLRPAPVSARDRSDFVNWLLFDQCLPGLKLALKLRRIGRSYVKMVDVMKNEYLLQACKHHAVYNMCHQTIKYLLNEYAVDMTDVVMDGNAAWVKQLNSRFYVPEEDRQTLNSLVGKLPGTNLFTFYVNAAKNQRKCLRYLIMAQDGRTVEDFVNWRGRGYLRDKFIDPRANGYEAFRIAVRLGRPVALVHLFNWKHPENPETEPIDGSYDNWILWRIHWNNLSLRIESPASHNRIGQILQDSDSVPDNVTSVYAQSGPPLQDMIVRRKRIQNAYGAFREIPDDLFDTEKDLDEISEALSRQMTQIEDWVQLDGEMFGLDSEESSYEESSSAPFLREDDDDDDDDDDDRNATSSSGQHTRTSAFTSSERVLFR